MNGARIYERAIKHFGICAQMLKLIEELGELSRAASRFLNKSNQEEFEANLENLCEEIADVEIVMEQIKLKLDLATLRHWQYKKLTRLDEMLKKAELA